jgi:predicted phage-related endonuclease
MPITPEQRAERRNHLGSSDLAAILNLDPFKTAWDVWASKTGQLDDYAPELLDGADPRYAGNILESSVLQFAADRLGPVEANRHKEIEGSPIAVNTDAVVVASGEPVEAKTVGLFGRLRDEEYWGEDGSVNQVPDRVIIQAHAHMIAWDRGLCHIPALIGGRGLVMLGVTRDDRLASTILFRANEFWQRYVLPKSPPPDVAGSIEILKLVRRQPNKVVPLDPTLVEAWLKAKDAESEAKDAAESAKAAVLTALGDAEAGNAGDAGAVTFMEQSRKEYVCKASTFRVLRHKKMI